MKIWKKTAAAVTCLAMLCSSAALMPASAETASIESAYNWDTLRIGGGGFVSGIVTGKDVMYARTDVGGAYKYNYDTGIWEQLFDFLTDAERGYLSVDAMAIDPNDDDTVYFLCGCAYFSDAGTRIYKTTDGGKTFTYADVTNLIQVHGNGYGRQTGEAIAVDPDNPDIIYAGGDATASTSGLIKSTDGGKTWKCVDGYGKLGLFTYTINWPLWADHQVQTTGEEYNGETNGVATIAITDGKVYVGTSVKDENNFVVADIEKDEFTRVSTDFPADKMPGRINFDADGNLLITYINGLAFDRGSGGAYRYDIKSGKVTDITPKPADGAEPGFGGVFSDPNDSNKLVATTLAQWYSQSYTEDAWEREAIAWGDRYFKSEDGGATWREMTPGNRDGWGGPLLAEYLDCGNFPWIKDKAIHWCGAIVLDPRDSNKFWVTSGNGIFTCDNTWDECPQLYFHPDGVEEVVALDMVSVEGFDPVSVIGDYDGFIHTSDTASDQLVPSMSKLTDGSASTAAVGQCAADPNVMVRVAEHTGKGYYTTDGGKSWTAMTFANEAGTLEINKLEDGTYRVYQGGKAKLSYTDDWGETWNTCSGIEGNGRPVGVQVDLQNPQYVYAYTAYYNEYWFYSKPAPDLEDAHYNFMVSDDYGKTFKSQQVVMYDQCDSAHRIAYLGEGECVIGAGWYGAYHVSDYGNTVEKLDSVFYCKTIGYGAPEKEGGLNTLYMYGQPAESDPEGIYRSTDAGKTWVCINTEHLYGGTGNGNFLVGDMNEFGKVYMSTVGCGIVYGSVGEGSVEPPKPTEKPTETESEPDSSETPSESTSSNIVWGDADENGKVDILDVITVNRSLVGKEKLSAQGKINADLNVDGIPDATDSLNILRLIVHLLSEEDFPLSK